MTSATSLYFLCSSFSRILFRSLFESFFIRLAILFWKKKQKISAALHLIITSSIILRNSFSKKSGLRSISLLEGFGGEWKWTCSKSSSPSILFSLRSSSSSSLLSLGWQKPESSEESRTTGVPWSGSSPSGSKCGLLFANDEVASSVWMLGVSGLFLDVLLLLASGSLQLFGLLFRCVWLWRRFAAFFGANFSALGCWNRCSFYYKSFNLILIMHTFHAFTTMKLALSICCSGKFEVPSATDMQMTAE